MLTISLDDIRARLHRDNPWWDNPHTEIFEATLPRRVYFSSFKEIALNFAVRRATILLGPRRVGKTVMIKQLVAEAIAEGIDPLSILYVSIDTPIYAGKSLESLMGLMSSSSSQKIVIFDEIQYLRNWEVHLKDLVDSYPLVKFVATGSAAAALKLKSQESGAGRFSDFMLPPLTFYEFLTFIGEDENFIELSFNFDEKLNPFQRYAAKNIEKLNSRFIDYLNYGGYPEAVMNPAIRDNPEQFIKNDIIDKVLLKDLPSLYGIQDIQELNKLFTFLAYNAGNEASFEKISRESGITKPTIKRYIEYLESAFLIMKVSNVDENCKSMKRETNFKIYLNNPSMRAALFSPVSEADSERIGHLTECAIFSQWQHSISFRNLRYARWRNEGEVDIVCLSVAVQTPAWIVEVKWSDRVLKEFDQSTKSMKMLIEKNKSIESAALTSKTVSKTLDLSGIPFNVVPSALYCYTVGRNVTKSQNRLGA